MQEIHDGPSTELDRILGALQNTRATSDALVDIMQHDDPMDSIGCPTSHRTYLIALPRALAGFRIKTYFEPPQLAR
jgi:hypothetical protein